MSDHTPGPELPQNHGDMSPAQPAADVEFTGPAAQQPDLPGTTPEQDSQLAGPEYTLHGVTGALALLRTVRGGERLPRTMDPEATRCLGRLGIYTTAMPEHPGGFFGYYRRAGSTWAELQRQKTNIDKQLRQVMDEPPEGFGPVLSESLDQVTRVVPTVENPQRHDGIVVLPRITLHITTPEVANRLEDIFQAALAAQPGKFCKVKAGEDEEGQPVLTLRNVSEYDIRDLERGFWEEMAEWFENDVRQDSAYAPPSGTYFPDTKRSRADLEADGHTFRQSVRDWLIAKERHYYWLAEKLDEDTTYIGFDDERHPRLDVGPLVQSAAVIFEILRKALNGGLPEDSIKFETNPNPHDPKLNIMDRVKITRHQPTPEERKKGPGSPVAMSSFEAWKAKALAEAHDHPWRTTALTTLKVMSKIPSVIGGLGLDLVAEGLQYAPGAETWAKRMLTVRRRWKDLKQKALAAHPYLDRAIGFFEEKEAELTAASPNPDHRVKG